MLWMDTSHQHELRAGLPMSNVRVAAVRPYGRRIRSRIFGALESLGARVDILVEPQSTDAEALAAVRGTDAHVLLIPFHAHRDKRGELVNGVELIGRIRADVASHRATPVLCPISGVGLAAAELMATRVGERLLANTLFLRADELDADGIRRTIETFLHDALTTQ